MEEQKMTAKFGARLFTRDAKTFCLIIRCIHLFIFKK